MRYTGLLIMALAGLVEAQDGTALYKERCASCHESPAGGVPSISAIRQMTAAAVYAAMTTGAMKSQTTGLSTQELISLLVYIAPAGDAGRKAGIRKELPRELPQLRIGQ